MRAAARFLCLVAGLLAAGCAQPPPVPQFEPISFADRGRIPLNVARIEVQRLYQPPLQAPNVEHTFPIPPMAALARWPDDRLEAAGTGGVARFVIEQASVVREPLEKRGGVTGMFVTEQDARYVADFRVRLEVESPQGLETGTVRTDASRTRSLAENVSLNDRDRFYYGLTLDVIAEMDAALEMNIRRHLPDFVVPR